MVFEILLSVEWIVDGQFSIQVCVKKNSVCIESSNIVTTQAIDYFSSLALSTFSTDAFFSDLRSAATK